MILHLYRWLSLYSLRSKTVAPSFVVHVSAENRIFIKRYVDWTSSNWALKAVKSYVNMP